MILLVSPAPPTSALGNGVTADRWVRILRDLGHEVVVERDYPRGANARGDLGALVALHARKSAQAVRDFRGAHPDRPIVIALTGTDLYPDLRSAGVDPDVLEMADRFVVLQEHGCQQLPDRLRPRCRVIVQSVPRMAPEPPLPDVFEVAFLAHLRPVKDPLLPASASRLLPPESRVRVTHVGADLDKDLAARARAESRDNPRYGWLGEASRPEALRLLARSRLLLLTSRHEGGANVVSEALAAGVPVLSSNIAGSTGLLGVDYPGLFPVGDSAALADALYAAESNRDGFYTQLTERCTALRELVRPDRERTAWAGLLSELALAVPA